MFGNPSLVSYDRPNTEKRPKPTPVFRPYDPQLIVSLIPEMLIFLESGGLGHLIFASEFLILGRIFVVEPQT